MGNRELCRHYNEIEDCQECQEEFNQIKLSRKIAARDRRFQAACAAMQGMLAANECSFGNIVRTSVEYADALLAELEKCGADDADSR